MIIPFRLLKDAVLAIVGMSAACAGFLLAMLAMGSWRLSLWFYEWSEQFLGIDDDRHETDLGDRY
jgi:hypothetical protein